MAGPKPITAAEQRGVLEDEAAWKVLAEQATAGPWVAEIDVRHDDTVHYSIRTADKLPEHPWSPRFIAWMSGTLSHNGRRLVKDSSMVQCEGCGNWSYRNGQIVDDFRGDPEIEPDAAFIAAARTAVPELLAEVERLREENERYHAEVVDALKARAAVCHHKAQRYAQELTGRDAKQAEREWNLGGNELLAMAELLAARRRGRGGEVSVTLTDEQWETVRDAAYEWEMGEQDTIA